MTKTDAPRSRRLMLTLVVTTAVIATAVLVALSQLSSSGGGENLYSGVPQRGTALGYDDAPVTVFVYEDYQCPFCAQFSREILPEIVRDHVEGGEAKVVSRPLIFLGEDSLEAARAALAAGEQGLYWQYHSLLFENQGAENSGYVTDEFLDDLAREVPGLNTGAWNEERTGDSFETELDEAQSGARSSGVNSTPTVVVSGPNGERKLMGAEDSGEISAAIEEIGGS